MRGSRLSFRLGVVAFAAIAAVLALGGFARGPQTTLAASFPASPTGVYCAQLSNLRINNAPQANFSGIALARIEVTSGNNIAFTGVAYTEGDLVKTMPTCTPPYQGAFPPSVAFTSQTSTMRPTATGTYTAATGAINATKCAENLALGGIPLPGWSKLIVTANINKAGTTATGSFQLRNPVNATTCTDMGGTIPYDVDVTGPYIHGPGGSVATFTHDYDKDGCTDWNELAVKSIRDPFNPADCHAAGGVGGVAEIAAPSEAALQDAASSSSHTGLIALVTGVALAIVVASGGVAYAWRRSLR